MVDLQTLVGNEIECTADWRARVMERFPEDDRNATAAKALAVLGEDIKQLEGSPVHSRLAALAENHGIEFSEILSAELKSVGFRSTYDTTSDFLEGLAESVESRTGDDEDADDIDTISNELTHALLLHKTLVAAIRGNEQTKYEESDETLGIFLLAEQVSAILQAIAVRLDLWQAEKSRLAEAA